MKMIERIIYVLLYVPIALLSILCLFLFIVLSVVLGLPCAALWFIFTGRSGIDRYADGPADWVLMHNPLFLWEDSMERRHNK